MGELPTISGERRSYLRWQRVADWKYLLLAVAEPESCCRRRHTEMEAKAKEVQNIGRGSVKMLTQWKLLIGPFKSTKLKLSNNTFSCAASIELREWHFSGNKQNSLTHWLQQISVLFFLKSADVNEQTFPSISKESFEKYHKNVKKTKKQQKHINSLPACSSIKNTDLGSPHSLSAKTLQIKSLLLCCLIGRFSPAKLLKLCNVALNSHCKYSSNQLADEQVHWKL